MAVRMVVEPKSNDVVLQAKAMDGVAIKVNNKKIQALLKK